MILYLHKTIRPLVATMTKTKLISELKNWLIKNTDGNLMHSTEFAEYKINKLLKEEANGSTIFENEQIFVGGYDYDFELTANCSSDGKSHHFCFHAIGIGSKENVCKNDYELSDYEEHTFIITQQ